MYKRQVIFILGLLLAAFVVQGATVEAVQAKAGVSGEDVLRPGQPYKGSTVMFISLNYLYSRAIKKLVPEFEKATGIKVKVELYGTEDNYIKQVTELSLGGYAYDANQVTPSKAPLYMAAGWLTPLDNYLTNLDLTPSAFDVNDFYSASMKANNWKGVQYALPIFTGSILYYYRTDVFEKYGIGNPAATFQELVDITEKIHSPEVAGIVLRGIPSTEQNMWPFTMIALGYGGFFKDFPNDMHPNLTDPNFIEAANLWKELFKYGPPGMNTFTHEEVILSGQRGLAAQWLDGQPLAGLFLDPERSEVIGKLAVAKTPRGPKGWFPPFSEHGIAIPKGSLNKDAAWEFIKWATSKEVLLEATQVTSYLSVTRKSVLAHPRYREKYSYFEGAFLDVSREIYEGRSRYYPAIPEWPTVGYVIARALSEVSAGISSAEDAFGRANSKIDRIMKNAGYYE